MPEINFVLIFLGFLAVLFVVKVIFLYKDKKYSELYGIVKNVLDEFDKKFTTSEEDGIKYDKVVEEIHKRIPPAFKGFLTESIIDDWIEKSIDDLKDFLNHRIDKGDSK